MDFVGQESPVSKARLFLLDILTLGLQLVILAIVLERRKLDTDPNPTRPSNHPSTSSQPPTTTQDHDSEERGILGPSTNIELQTFSQGRTGADEDRERNELPSPSLHSQDPSTLAAAPPEHPLDPFHSGQHIIANLGILDTIRAQWTQYGDFASAVRNAASASASEGSEGGTARRRIGFRIGGLEIRGGFGSGR